MLFWFSVIYEANWLNLMEDIEEVPEGGFDAIIAMGNSFAHLPDFSGDQRDQQLAIQVHIKCLAT